MTLTTTTKMRRDHKPTNPNWNNFEKVQDENKNILNNSNPVTKRDRKDCLKMHEFNAMPSGLYPVLVTGHGWMKTWVHMVDFQTYYITRVDLNLDLQVFRMLYDGDGDIQSR